jgi:hypothetical protein
MKQKDIALIIVIAVISGVISLIVSGKVFVTPANRQQKVEVVDQITSDFQKPDKQYFNSQSIDPAQSIELGPANNQNPFNGAGGQ